MTDAIAKVFDVKLDSSYVCGEVLSTKSFVRNTASVADACATIVQVDRQQAGFNTHAKRVRGQLWRGAWRNGSYLGDILAEISRFSLPRTSSFDVEISTHLH